MGSKSGWLVAGVIVLAILGYIVIKLVFPSPSGPDKTNERVLAFKEAPDWPTRCAAPQPRGGGDAGDDYLRAAKLADSKSDHIAALFRIIRGGAKSIPPEHLGYVMEIYGHVADGARKAQATYATRFPDQLHVAPGFLPARDLKKVADVLRLLFNHNYRGKEYDRAEEVARATFAMGRHLMDERGHSNIVLVGIGLQIQALGHFEALYAYPPKADPAALKQSQDYYRQLQVLRDAYDMKLQILNSRNLSVGDVFNIAENDKDHAWRVQGIQMLGLAKFVTNRRGDRKHAQSLLNKFARSDDGLIAAAARVADEFTAEDFKAYTSAAIPSPVEWPPGVEYYD